MTEGLAAVEGPKTAPQDPPVDLKALGHALFYLQEHIRIVMQWSRRGDMRPDVVEAIEGIHVSFGQVAKIVPPVNPL